jgi:uncharacterized RmlC-like cupin family protein
MNELDVRKSILIHSESGRRSGISDETIPGSRILMHVMTVKPGETVLPGNAPDAETAAYILSGRARIIAERSSAEGTEVGSGSFYFTPAQQPYRIHNAGNEPLEIVLAYSLDPSISNGTSNTDPSRTQPGVHVVREPLDANRTAQTRGMRRVPAICAETTGATQIWMCHLTVEPHERGQPHHHGRAHTAAYTISGRARICFGENFADYIEPRAGDFAFDPPGLVHLVDHPFDDEPWKGVLARCPDNTVINIGS